MKLSQLRKGVPVSVTATKATAVRLRLLDGKKLLGHSTIAAGAGVLPAGEADGQQPAGPQGQGRAQADDRGRGAVDVVPRQGLIRVTLKTKR